GLNDDPLDEPSNCARGKVALPEDSSSPLWGNQVGQEGWMVGLRKQPIRMTINPRPIRRNILLEAKNDIQAISIRYPELPHGPNVVCKERFKLLLAQPLQMGRLGHVPCPVPIHCSPHFLDLIVDVHTTRERVDCTVNDHLPIVRHKVT